jgi:hypothetical protein
MCQAQLVGQVRAQGASPVAFGRVVSAGEKTNASLSRQMRLRLGNFTGNESVYALRNGFFK